MMALYFLLTIWILFASLARQNTLLNNNYSARLLSCFFTIIVLFIVTNRNFLVGDISKYVREFLSYSQMPFFSALGYNTREFGFFFAQWVVAQFTTSPEIFGGSIFIFFIAIFFWALRKIFFPWQVLFVAFTYFHFFIFYDYILNAIRQGFALVFMLLALGFIVKGDKWKYLICSLTSILFHVSGVVSLTLAFLWVKRIKLKNFIFIWLLATAFLFLGFYEWLFGTIFKFSPFYNYFLTYTSRSAFLRYPSAYRIDFIAFSVFWLIWGLFHMKYLPKKDKNFKILFKAYIILNIVFVCFGFIAWSDRVASYSWFLIPLLIWYPIFQLKKYRLVTSFVMLLGVLLASIFKGTINRFIGFGGVF